MAWASEQKPLQWGKWQVVFAKNTMRKLSLKWPVSFTIVALSMPAFYFYHRIKQPGIFDLVEFAGKVLAAVFFTVVVWAVYLLACFLARTPKCPSCGGKQVAKFLYGIPKITKQIERDVEAGRILLGGVADKKHSPKWYCNDCQQEW